MPPAMRGGARTWRPQGSGAAAERAVRQANAELAVRDMLRAFGSSRQARGLPLEVSAEDHMDDGSPIRLRVQINLSQVRPRGRGPGHPRRGLLLTRDAPRPPPRAAPCLTSAAPGPRCSATSTRRGPSRCRRSSTACAAWWAATSRLTRCLSSCASWGGGQPDNLGALVVGPRRFPDRPESCPPPPSRAAWRRCAS